MSLLLRLRQGYRSYVSGYRHYLRRRGFGNHLHDRPFVLKGFLACWAMPGFHRFWQVWNPGIGYLTYRLYLVLGGGTHREGATVATFVVNGLVHTIVICPFFGHWSWTLIAAFLLFGILTILSRRLEPVLRQERWPAIANLAVNVGLTLVLFLASFILSARTPCSFVGLGNRRVAGSGIVTRSSLPLADFRAVELQFHGDLLINMGDEAQLTIEAEDNLLDYLEAQVLGETLIIRKMPSNVTLDSTAPIRYYLTATGLESLTTTSSGSIQAPALEANRLSITAKSSGSVYVDELHAAHLEVTVQAAGGVTLAGGRVEEQWITLTSSGGYDGQELTSSRARVRLSSSGDAILSVRDRLDADLSSSGNLYYLGNPSVHVSDSSSEGRVIRVRE